MIDAVHRTDTEELKVSRDTVERLIGEGKLKAAEITTERGKGLRKRYRIRKEWVDEFLLSTIRKVADTNPRPLNRKLEGKIDFIR